MFVWSSSWPTTMFEYLICCYFFTDWRGLQTDESIGKTERGKRYCCLDCDWNNFPSASHTHFDCQNWPVAVKNQTKGHHQLLLQQLPKLKSREKSFTFPAKNVRMRRMIVRVYVNWTYMYSKLADAMLREAKSAIFIALCCTCNMQLMTLLGFRRNISYFKAPVRCIGRLLFAGRHTNMLLRWLQKYWTTSRNATSTLVF